MPVPALRRPGAAALALLVLASCAAPAARSPKRAVEEIRPPQVRIAEAREALAADENDTEAWFQLGLGFQDSSAPGSADSALVAFRKLLALEPERVEAVVHYGLALEDAKRYQDALEQYERATELAPDDPLPWINLGSLLYFQFKRTNESKEALTRALELAPDNPDAHFNLGVLFADANLLGEARVEWEKVLEITQEGPAANLARENLERIRPYLAESEAASGGASSGPKKAAPGARLADPLAD